eukprot:m.134094 g.134094  ORF g.134094 m.134094 type:complete len:57 (-) comp15970_c0_seq2:1229-1399(-)
MVEAAHNLFEQAKVLLSADKSCSTSNIVCISLSSRAFLITTHLCHGFQLTRLHTHK